MYNDDPLRQRRPHTRTSQVTKVTHTQTLLHSKAGRAGRIGLRGGRKKERGVGTTRPGSGGCCRMASAFPNPADAWATTWARILDLCADVNGAPFERTPPRRSWGRGPSPQGWRRIQARRSTCLLLRTVQRRRAESLVLGAFHHIASTPCFCVGIGDQRCVARQPGASTTLKPTSTFKRAVYHA